MIDLPYRIRAARPEDAPALAAAAKKIAAEPGLLALRPEELHSQDFRTKIAALSENNRARYLVIEVKGFLAGYAILEPHPWTALQHVAFLTIAVHQDFQGRGLGRILMQDLIEWARAHPHIEKLELQVRSANQRAIKLYESLGFAEEGRKTRRVKLATGHYLDDVYMALWVGPI
ncbi:MAG: GNAT family N-acetyltransferase [Vulcanimicrobiota bacterium]